MLATHPQTTLDPDLLIAHLRAELERLPGAALGGDLIAWSRFQDMLNALLAEQSVRFANSEAWYQDGFNSGTSWLRNKCRLAPGAASTRLGLGRKLDQLPAAAAALHDGEIGYQHAVLLYQLAEAVGYEPVAALEAELVEKAKEMEPNTFARLLQHFRQMVDPDGCLEDARLAEERRYLAFDQSLDGIFYLKGKFGPDDGAAIQATLLPLSKKVAGDGRSPGNRRADALLDLVRMALDSGRLPDLGGDKPHVTLTVSVETLAGVPGSPPAELGDRIAVPTETARRICCDAAITLIPLDRKGNPLNVGRTRRTCTRKQKLALDLRDKGCVFPGCQRPWFWTDAHHLVPWEVGGPTDLDNLCLLCRHHHKLVHEGGWTIGWNDQHDGFFVIPPDDRVYYLSG